MKYTIAVFFAFLATAAIASPNLEIRQSNTTGPFKIEVTRPPVNGHSVAPYEGQFLGITLDPSGSSRPSVVANHTFDDAFVWQFSDSKIQTTIDVEGQIESWVVEGDVYQIILAQDGSRGFGNDFPSTAEDPRDPGIGLSGTSFRGWALCNIFSDSPALLYAKLGESLSTCTSVDLTVVPV